MRRFQQPNVAVLLATHNGARFVDAQVRSLAENAATITLHWLDDHSTDDTLEIVRKSARNVGIELCEWHCKERLGVPGAFFQLLDYVEADIYFFCDQDDIWQPGKIDVMVATLLPDLSRAVHRYTESLAFFEEEPGTFFPCSKVFGMVPAWAAEESRAFMSTLAFGNTTAFTRPLRDIYLEHKDIARSHAFMHDWWMYIIACASGSSERLSGVPTTLYRRHRSAVSEKWQNNRSIATTWNTQQTMRQAASRQAQGLLLSAPTLPPGEHLDRMLRVARMLTRVDRRQSVARIYQLIRNRVMPASRKSTFWYSAACLSSHATS
jgi:glycosyltransferase involved in cell wall biosynthesis